MKIIKKKVKREYFVCPKCKKEKLSILGTQVKYYFKEYIETLSEYALRDLKNVVNNLNKYHKLKLNFINIKRKLKENFNKYWKKSNNLLTTPKGVLESSTEWELVFISKLLNIDKKILLMDECKCYSCNNIFTFKTWNKNTKKKIITAYVCKNCERMKDEKNKDVDVEDDPENYSNIGLICPMCGKHVNNLDLEILNELSSRNNYNFRYHLADHIKYDKKQHLITFEPYSAYPEDLILLFDKCKKLDYSCWISGSSIHNRDAMTINIQKINKDINNTEVK